MADNTEQKKRGGKVKEYFSELKKVSWPKFPEVIKKTGTVLAVTIFFLAAVMIIDVGLSQLYKLLITGLSA